MAQHGYTGPLRFEDIELDLASTMLEIRPVQVEQDPFGQLFDVVRDALDDGHAPEAFSARLKGPAEIVEELAAAYRAAYALRYPR